MPVEPWKRYVPGMRASRMQAAHLLGVARARGVEIATGRCEQCVAEFVRSSGAQRFCSLECAADARRDRRRLPARLVDCAACGQTFTAIRRDAVFCSSGCRVRALRARAGAAT